MVCLQLGSSKVFHLYGEATTRSKRPIRPLIMTTSTSTIFSPAIDFNSAQITTTKGTIHKQMVRKLAKPHLKEIERVCREIQDESKNKKPKVHFLIYENDQPLKIELNCVGYAESEYHIKCVSYAVENRWIRTDDSDFDKQYLISMCKFVQGVLQKKKSHLLVVVVDGYICRCDIITPNASPTGYKFMRGL